MLPDLEFEFVLTLHKCLMSPCITIINKVSNGHEDDINILYAETKVLRLDISRPIFNIDSTD